MTLLSAPPRRILLIKPSSMGDVIHALPVAAALHDAWPDTEIGWVIQPVWSDLIEHHPGLVKIIPFPREHFHGPLGWWRSLLWANTLRNWPPDLVIDLQGLLRSALMARCSRASKVVGLSSAREGATLFYSAVAMVDHKKHAVNQLLAVLDLLGISRPTSPQFTLPLGELPAGFTVPQPFVVLHPYARGAGKSLTPDQVVKAIIASNLGYDQVIREFDRWTHLSIPNTPDAKPRKQALIIDKSGTRAYA